MSAGETPPRQTISQSEEIDMYGKAPEAVAPLSLNWAEYMHYLYLPVWMPGEGSLRLPERLSFLATALNVACFEEHKRRGGTDWLDEHFIYVTAKHGYASPGNPLNRPGWHCDGFGTDDVNYIWTDRYPTRFAVGDFGEISPDHVESARQFDQLADSAYHYKYGPIKQTEAEPLTLYRLDPFVVHSVPVIPSPGGERSFLKISFSRDRYNLRGNSHNYLFDYDWRMWDRSEIRNDPAYAGGDAGPQEMSADAA